MSIGRQRFTRVNPRTIPLRRHKELDVLDAGATRVH